jgi:uncharacterized damage-inducible protein DinB
MSMAKEMMQQQPEPNDVSPEALAREFVAISRRQLKTRVERIEACVAKLRPDQLWGREHETENAIGNLVLHLAGNVRQWIICGVGNTPGERDRDAEFSRREPLAAEELLARLRQTMNEADGVLARISASELLVKRRIQVYEVTVLDAVYHVVEHFAEHTGQIIWATKRMTGEDLGFYSYLSKKNVPASGKVTP